MKDLIRKNRDYLLFLSFFSLAILITGFFYKSSLILFSLGIIFSLFTFVTLNFIRNKNSKNSLELKDDHNDGPSYYQKLVHLLVHDISSPLNVIKFYISELKNPDQSQTLYTKAVMTIDKNLHAIEQTTNKVKELSTLVSGKRIIQLKPSNVESCLNKSVELFHEKYERKQMTLEYHIEGSSFDAIIEPEIFTFQILPNLLDNALKFSHQGSKVQVYLRREKKNIHIEITDQGIGIPNFILENIFSFSSQTNRFGTDGEKGTGLGLPLVKNFLEKMNAKIQIDTIPFTTSDRPHGTKVHITLPATENLTSSLRPPVAY